MIAERQSLAQMVRLARLGTVSVVKKLKILQLMDPAKNAHPKLKILTSNFEKKSTSIFVKLKVSANKNQGTIICFFNF